MQAKGTTARAGVPAARRRDGITRAPGAVVRHGTGVAPTGARLRAQRVARDRHNRLLMPGVVVFSSNISVVGPRASRHPGMSFGHDLPPRSALPHATHD